MALNVFAFDNIPASRDGMGAPRPSDAKGAIDGIAGRYQVPANVLLAMKEAGSADTEADARDLSAAVAAGQTIEAALAAKIGDPARSQAVLIRAYDIADEMYPAAPPAKVEPSTVRDTLGNLGQSVVSGVGSAVRGVGEGLATGIDAINEGINIPARAITGENLVGPAPNMLAGVADNIQGRAEAFGADNISDEYRANMEASRPGGELLSPSTWNFGDDPTVSGYAAQAVSVFGSLLPVVVAGALTGGAGAAATGGAMSGGSGVEQAEATIDQMAAEIMPDGRSRLEAESTTYQGYIAGGMSPADAVAATKRDAGRIAFTFTAPVGALGGFATQKIVSGAATAAAGGNLATRVGANAALGAVEEGTQEVIEGVAGRAGLNLGAGTDENIAEDSFGNFVLGAMGGAPVGALGGFARPDQPAAEQNAQPESIAPPPQVTPDGAQPQPNTPAEAAAGVSPSQPATPPAGVAADAFSPAPVATPPVPVPPAGPIARAAAVAPDLTPLPEAPPAPVRFPDQKPGTKVRLADPETGVIYDAVFVREDPDGPVLRIEGNEITVTPQEFDQARLTARGADEATVVAAGGKPKPRAVRVPETIASPPPVQPAPSAPDERPLSQRAAPQPQRRGEPPITPVEAVRAMAGIRNFSPEAKWTPETRARYEELQRIAQPEAPQDASPDAGTVPAIRGKAQDGGSEGDQGNPQQPVEAGGVRGPGEPLAGPVAAPDLDAANPSGQPPAGVAAASPVIEDIRERAAVLRGVPEDRPPVVDGVSLKWDAKEKGFIFSRNHKDKVQAALSKPAEKPKPVRTPLGKNANGNPVFEDERGVRSYVEKGVRITEPVRMIPNEDGSTSTMPSPNRSGEFEVFDPNATAPAAVTPTAEEVTAAAKEADPSPTDAQKEAGNYRMAHIQWNGLDITIETPKGGTRSGKSPDGKAWSVKLPAHYGYIRGTTGADGDHLDVYMGETPDSDEVFVFDQYDPKTGKFDETKTVLGATSLEEATTIYDAGFSDGSGPRRRKGPMGLTVEQFKAWLAKNGATKKPASNITTRDVEKPADRDGDKVNTSAPVVKPAETSDSVAPASAQPKRMKGLTDAENAALADLEAQFMAAMNGSQLNSGLDPKLVAIAAQIGALYVKAGTRRFKALLEAMMQRLGLTLEQAQPYARNAYNQIRGDMELAGEDIADMDSDAEVIAEVRKMRASAIKSVPASTPDPEPAKLETKKEPEVSDDQRTDAGNGGASPSEGARDPERGPGQAEGIRDLFGADGNGRGRSAERAADGPEPGTDGAGDRVSGRTGSGVGPDGIRAANHVIPAGGLDLARGEKTRARESIEALRVLRTIQAEGRPATSDERAALAKYGGAGTLAGTLPRSNGTIKFPDLASEIDALLSPEEKVTLSRTSQYAFYTAESALRGMWALAEQLGFKGGRVYEPGMGVGGFAGTIPANIRSLTRYQGLELDLVTAQIAKALYPGHAIAQGDFIKTPLAQNFYDLVIGNPPFSGTQVQADPAYPQRFMLHDYFFAKSLDAVRPGGLLMFITSAGTMNKQSTEARDYLADRADLVGAIRLPNTAFKENGTEVTTDIIVLRKRMEGEKEANPGWRKSAKMNLPDKDGVLDDVFVNQYFIDNPAMILGEQGRYDTLTAGARVGVRPRPGSDLRIDLAKAFQSFPTGIMGEAAASVQMGAVDATSPETKRGGFYIKDGVLHQFDGSAGQVVQQRSAAAPSGMSKGDHARIAALVPIKMALRDVYAADLDGKDATAARKALNAAYDAFVKAYGPINLETQQERRPSRVQKESARQRAAEDARAIGETFDIGSFDGGPLIASGMSMAKVAEARAVAREAPGYREGTFNPETVPDTIIVKRPNIDPMLGGADRMGDQEAYRLRAIEKFDSATGKASKTAIFTENALRKVATPKINSPEDALLFTLAQDGKIDMASVANLAGVSEEAVLRDLEGKVFQNPANGQFETRAKYLSGNVRQKLAAAQDAARTNPAMIPNVRALSDVQPEPIPAAEIRVPIGAHWFDSAIYTQYAKTKGLRFRATFKPALGMWVVDGEDRGPLATSDYGTADYPFPDLMRAVMNNKAIKVTRTTRNPDGTSETRLDDEATQAAKDKAAELQGDFTQWLWSDEARTADLETAYNEKFNAEVAPAYDGAYLTTPGVNAKWSWRPHQTSVIARILQSGSTYMAHTVGAGKTSAMIGAGMEAKRLGLARKPMYAVPNHMLEQFSKEFYEQYPLANIAIADESRFHTSRRKEFVADIALNDYDAIIMTHSAFGLVPSSEAAIARAVEDILRDIREVYETLGTGDKGADQAILGSIMSIAGTLGVDTKSLTEKGVSTRKKIEQLLEAAEQRISRQVSTRGKDQVFNFDEIGVDMLFVDEAHLYRKLSFATQNGNIKGIDPAGSQAAMDLFIKTRTLDAINPGRGLVLASGTPITNTMAELYSISRYIQPDAMEARGVTSFDAWAATFGQTDTALEQQPDGSYKQVSRFAKFVNTPELSLMVRQQMDVVTGADLEKYVTRPAIKGGKRNVVVVEASSEAKAYQQGLAARMEAIANRKGPVSKGDDILLSVINDGRLAAIDMRLVDPDATGAGSKLEAMVQKVYRRWKEGAETPLYGVKPEGGYTEKPVMTGPGTQIVFSTLGVNPSKHNPGFSVHRFIRSELIRMGVPAGDIIVADDINSHAKRQRAFNDMNEGTKRILIGSKTLFTGVNAQRRLTAIHNLDPLWYPADDEQRNGRGIRQGNMNPEIEINDYTTKGTYDATMWQMMGRKASFIEAFYRGDPSIREMEDLGEASQYEQAKAMTTADPRVQVLADLRNERDTLNRRKGAAASQRRRLEQDIRNADRTAELYEAEVKVWDAAAAKVTETKGDAFTASIGKETFDKRAEAGIALIELAEGALADPETAKVQTVAQIGGLGVELHVSHAAMLVDYKVRATPDAAIEAGFSVDPVGLMRRIEGAVQSVAETPAKLRTEVERQRKKSEDATAAIARLKAFAQQSELDEVTAKVDALEAELLADSAAKAAPAEPDKEMREIGEPVATLTGDELGPWEDILELQKKARQWYRDNLQGSSVVNADTGWSIRFSRDGQGKIGAKGEYLLQSVPGLKSILERAVKVGESADSKGRQNVKAYHYLRADVSVAGQVQSIIVTIRELVDGRKFYDIAKDNNVGARTFDGPMGTQESRVAPDMELGADVLNIAYADQQFNLVPKPVMASAFRDISVMMNQELRVAGLEGKVSGALVRGLVGAAGIPIQGRQSGAGIEVNAQSKDPLGVMRHEIIHALRDAGLWGKPYGLFNAEEWRALVKAARADKDIVARVEKAYPDLGTAAQTEEMVAELYRGWSQRSDTSGPVAKAFGKVAAFFRSLASALRGSGFEDAASVMQRIADGDVGGRGATSVGGDRTPDAPKEARADLFAKLNKTAAGNAKFIAGLGQNWRNPTEWLTDAMSGEDGYNLLALVPGRALYAELGKNLSAAQAYLREQTSMDALRNAWHARSDEVAQKWMKLRRGDPEANDAFMDLMHRSTLSGIDPSKPDPWRHAMEKSAEREISRYGDSAEAWARDVMQQIENRKRAYATLKTMFDALPPEFQKMYGTVRKEYDQMGDDFEKAVLDNMENATRIALKRAERDFSKEMQRITDEGLDGPERDEAIERAETTLNNIKKRGGWGSKARMAALRKQFESNRLKGPYFPLARFGDFFVTARNAQGEVVSFSRFESVKAQEVEARRQKEAGYAVQKGVMSDAGAARGQVDPSFVADVEKMLAESGASAEVMDMVWQRWLETLPDQSIRTAKIHRKGREGFNSDAFRAFGKHMFHGAHQLARLKHGLLMEEHLNDARDQVRLADDTNRTGLIVNEMQKRHDFAMNPQTNSALASVSSLAFIWYLGVSPAAALANLFQTTVMGPGIMAAKYGKAGMKGASVELARAMKDFASGRGEAARAESLNADERAAMAEAYRRGTVDKSQAHDLASVADTGIEYSARRERIMKAIGFFFHHAERMNREVTFLATYRLGKQEGLSSEDAIDKAASTTWMIHYDYQNSMRPRFMQGDIGRALTQFRQFQVNSLWRLARDLHQMTRGKTAEDRKEARTQFIGITLSMMAHAGIKGTWGYGLIMTMLGVFFPGGGDDAEEWLQDSLLMEGDDPGTAAWNWAMGAALNGLPGQVTGAALSERIGMPNLWFRGPSRDLEGADLYNHYVGEVLGPVYGIGAGFFRGATTVFEDPYRAVETAVPKFVRDVMKAGRYGYEGVLTGKGDPILEDVSVYQMLLTANGFTPAQVAERYEINSRLKNEEMRLMEERRGIQQTTVDLIRDGEQISEDVIAEIRDWNMRYPEYPITPKTIRQSVRARAAASERNEFGIQLNPKLNDRLRGELAPSIYQ